MIKISGKQYIIIHLKNHWFIWSTRIYQCTTKYTSTMYNHEMGTNTMISSPALSNVTITSIIINALTWNNVLTLTKNRHQFTSDNVKSILIFYFEHVQWNGFCNYPFKFRHTSTFTNTYNTTTCTGTTYVLYLLCLFVYSGVQHILWCVLVLFSFVLRTMWC